MEFIVLFTSLVVVVVVIIFFFVRAILLLTNEHGCRFSITEKLEEAEVLHS
jgi:hypothetical protein